MSFLAQLSSIFGGTKPGVGAPAHAQSIQAPAQSGSVTTDANRANAVMLAQVPQTTQAPQAQSPEAQIENLFGEFQKQKPMEALELLTKLMIPFMGMLGMGPAPTAEKPAQAQLGLGQAPQANTSESLDNLLNGILNQNPGSTTPTAQASSQQQQPVQLASQTPPAPAPAQAPTLVA